MSSDSEAYGPYPVWVGVMRMAIAEPSLAMAPLGKLQLETLQSESGYGKI